MSKPIANVLSPESDINSGVSSKLFTTIADNSPLLIKLSIFDEKKRNTTVIVAIEAIPPTSV